MANPNPTQSTLRPTAVADARAHPIPSDAPSDSSDPSTAKAMASSPRNDQHHYLFLKRGLKPSMRESSFHKHHEKLLFTEIVSTKTEIHANPSSEKSICAAIP
jgi:hypothetical protein